MLCDSTVKFKSKDVLFLGFLSSSILSFCFIFQNSNVVISRFQWLIPAE